VQFLLFPMRPQWSGDTPEPLSTQDLKYTATTMNSLNSKHCGRSLRVALMIAIVTALPGCAMRGTLSAWKKTPKPQNFQINYVLQNASRELDPWSSFSDQGLKAASWSQETQVSSTRKQPVELSIEFPHPDQESDTALATLSIFSQPLDSKTFQPTRSRSWMTRLWPRHTTREETKLPLPDEVITLELSREEFDRLMSELNREQYLDENTREVPPHVPAALSISRNDHQVHSSLEVAPQLNELIRKIYHEGNQILGNRHEGGPSVLQTSGLSAPSPMFVE